MTINSLFFGRRNGHHALRSSAAVAAILGVHQSETTAFEAASLRGTDASRTAILHTNREWNALRHAC
jgi:hypothetical protein